jgi:hypothetical protein
LFAEKLKWIPSALKCACEVDEIIKERKISEKISLLFLQIAPSVSIQIKVVAQEISAFHRKSIYHPNLTNTNPVLGGK